MELALLMTMAQLSAPKHKELTNATNTSQRLRTDES
jgi:hypothetical protein